VLILEGKEKCPKNKKQQNYHTALEVVEGSLRGGELLAGGWWKWQSKQWNWERAKATRGTR